MKIAGRKRWILAIALLSVVALLWLARTPDTDRQEMLAKYGGAQARFVTDSYGGSIHYRLAGPANAPAVVLIHGANSSLQTWDTVAKQLADRYRVVTVDLYGHGLTGPSAKADYSAKSMMGAVAKVLDAAGIRSAVWVGNSMGGWVSWRAALALPQRVCGLALVDASGAQTGEAPKLYLGARLMQTGIGQAILPHFSPRWIIKSSLKQTYADPAKLSDHVVDRYWELNRFPGNRQAAVDRANTSREPGEWSKIGQIKVPTIIFWGRQDHVTPPSHATAFADKIKGSSLIIYPDAGHLPMEETPDAFARDLGKWLADTGTKGCEPGGSS
jgi:pimeloyl-ACP methyl ester carboxylesterase